MRVYDHALVTSYTVYPTSDRWQLRQRGSSYCTMIETIILTVTLSA